MIRPRLTPILYVFYALGERLSHGVRRRVTELGWFMLVSTFVIGLSGIDTHWSAHHQIFALMLVMLGLSLVSLVGRFRPKLEVRRVCPRFATVGVAVRYAVFVTHAGRWRYHGLRLREWLPTMLPTRAEFVNRPEPREKERNLFDRTFVYYRWLWLLGAKRIARARMSEAFTVRHGQTVRVMLEIQPQRRGLLPLKHLRVVRRDPFGFFQRTHKARARGDSLLILPRRYVLGRAAFFGSRRLEDSGSSIVSPAMAFSEEFIGLRDYRPGDPPRHIHWRSWARLSRPVVKEFEEEHLPRFALALDIVTAPAADYQLFEEAVSVAASFVGEGTEGGGQLEWLFVGGRAYGCGGVAPRTPSLEDEMLEVLALVNATADEGVFAEWRGQLLARTAEVRALLLVFANWTPEREELMSALRARGVMCRALVVVPEGREPVAGVDFLPLGAVGQALASLDLQGEAGGGVRRKST